MPARARGPSGSRRASALPHRPAPRHGPRIGRPSGTPRGGTSRPFRAAAPRRAHGPGPRSDAAILAHDLRAGTRQAVDGDEYLVAPPRGSGPGRSGARRRAGRRQDRRRQGIERPGSRGQSSNRSDRRSRSAAKQSCPRPSARSPRVQGRRRGRHRPWVDRVNISKRVDVERPDRLEPEPERLAGRPRGSPPGRVRRRTGGAQLVEGLAERAGGRADRLGPQVGRDGLARPGSPGEGQEREQGLRVATREADLAAAGRLTENRPSRVIASRGAIVAGAITALPLGRRGGRDVRPDPPRAGRQDRGRRTPRPTDAPQGFHDRRVPRRQPSDGMHRVVSGYRRGDQRPDTECVGKPTPGGRYTFATVPLATFAFDFDPLLRVGDLAVRWQTVALAVVIVVCLAAVGRGGATPRPASRRPPVYRHRRGAGRRGRRPDRVCAHAARWRSPTASSPSPIRRWVASRRDWAWSAGS